MIIPFLHLSFPIVQTKQQIPLLWYDQYLINRGRAYLAWNNHTLSVAASRTHPYRLVCKDQLIEPTKCFYIIIHILYYKEVKTKKYQPCDYLLKSHYGLVIFSNNGFDLYKSESSSTTKLCQSAFGRTSVITR